MKKTLIVVAHPNIEGSIVNKRWIEELKKYPDQFTVHELYKVYPDSKINIENEQALIEQHGHLILQFPVYWFNCTPLLKQWLDEVFTYGWAYGSTGNKLKDKKFALAVSAGISEEEDKDEHYPFSLQQIFKSFAAIANYVKADYQPLFALYGANNESDSAQKITAEQVNQSAADYIEFLSRL